MSSTDTSRGHVDMPFDDPIDFRLRMFTPSSRSHWLGVQPGDMTVTVHVGEAQASERRGGVPQRGLHLKRRLTLEPVGSTLPLYGNKTAQPGSRVMTHAPSQHALAVACWQEPATAVLPVGGSAYSGADAYW